MNLSDAILVLCTQASFALSFMLMSQIYNNLTKGIHVFSKSIKYKIIDENDSTINIHLEGKYKLKNINLEKKMGYINTLTMLKFYKNKKSNCIPKYGFIYWDFQDIH